MKKSYVLKKGFICLVLMLTLLLSNTMTSFATTLDETENSSTSNSDDYQIDDLTSLKNEIHEELDGGKITTLEKKEIVESADPEIIRDFMDEKLEKLEDIVSSTELEINSSGDESSTKTKINLGDGCYVEQTSVDEEDLSTTDKLENTISSLLIDKVYAASVLVDANTVTKAYGKRKYTTTEGYFLVFGYGQIKLTNRYTLSSSGIKERYGTTSVKYASAFSDIDVTQPVITSSTASSARQSASMYATFHFSTGVTIGGVPLKYGGTCKYTSKLTLKSINKSAGTVTLEQKGVVSDL